MDEEVLAKVQDLDDLELAVLVALISKEQCLFWTDKSATLELQHEIQLICTETFGVEPALVDCTSETTIDELNEAILVDSNGWDERSMGEHEQTAETTALSVSFSKPKLSRFNTSKSTALDDRRIARVIIIRNLDLASHNVQVQLIEILRTKRMFTRTSMHTAPKDILLMAIASKPGARLFGHLNDMIAMSHFHAADDGFAHMDGESTSSMLSRTEVDRLRAQSARIQLTAEIDGYLHNVVLFMRMSRYVQGGITATATRHLRTLSKALAPLHGLDFVTPSLIMLATRKIYPHRIILATERSEKSLQWGSDPQAVRRILQDVTTDDVIEDVIASVETPL